MFDFGPEKLPGVLRNGPKFARFLDNVKHGGNGKKAQLLLFSAC